MIKTGIYGGTFNPIHFGHIRLAKLLLEKAQLDEVWFMVTPQNPFKVNQELVWDRYRYEMVEGALRRYKRLIASDFEFGLPKPSFTWNTLEALSKKYPDREFTVLIGGDNWEKIRLWHRHEDILANYHVMVYPREGSSFDMNSLPPSVQVVDTPLIPISSTKVRQRLAQGKSVTRMVPKAAISFIESHGLYGITPKNSIHHGQ